MTAAAAPVAAARRFDERFLRRLETLELAVRRAAGARARGIRRTRRIGAGLELADHRDYVPGDDLRYLDWNLYGRLDRRALRLFEEDEDVAIDVLASGGGRQLTHRAVDAAAGLPVGSTSNRFRTRDALLGGVLGRILERETAVWADLDVDLADGDLDTFCTAMGRAVEVLSFADRSQGGVRGLHLGRSLDRRCVPEPAHLEHRLLPGRRG